ncbi:Imm8 family immunity protein [Arthrobacter sp. BF1]|uniref:Imm8 family immunity protein n=1 Tax=Arthrobacter sp. BF1 TaxID=2821145 RepID=UPI001C4EB65D|nr:Imm8 family immunity protein [Arthrobacter sp. BF1]
MKAAIRWLGSLDIDDMDSWRPKEKSWSVNIRLLAGPRGEPGEESFDITVCSTAWIDELIARDGLWNGRHHLIVDGFNWQRIRSYIVGHVNACQGPTWSEVAEQLSRLGYWEFENYQP